MTQLTRSPSPGTIQVVVKIMGPFGVPIIMRHLIFRVPQRDQNLDSDPNSIVHVMVPGLARRHVLDTRTLKPIIRQHWNPKGWCE